jgi:hypothetical protein
MQRQEFLRFSPTNPTIKMIQNEYETNYESIFNSAIKNWNQRIRLFMNDSMGVKLSDDSGGSRVPIKLQPVMNIEFLTLIDRAFPTLDFDEYPILNNFVQSAQKSICYYKNPSEIKKLNSSIEYAKNRLSNVKLDEIINKLFNFVKEKEHCSDVFGAYFPNIPIIEIYLIPIILFCKLTEIDFTSFFLVVIKHEISHAYSHLGKDKDNCIWKTFREATPEVKESIAQYYTLRYTKKVFANNHQLFYSFMELLKKQPDYYRLSFDWPFELEEVSSALIETKRRGTKTYQDFENILKNSGNRIHLVSEQENNNSQQLNLMN